MKKKYSFGELLLVLREEYRECKSIIDELNNCVKVDSDSTHHSFSAFLSQSHDKQDISDRKVKLFLQKKYMEILKRFYHLKYGLASAFLYNASFDVVKGNDDQYDLKYNDVFTPFNHKNYKPLVQIIDRDKFSFLIDKLLSTDLMQLKMGRFDINYNLVKLDFSTASIDDLLGDNFSLEWDGFNDIIAYSMEKREGPGFLSLIFDLKVPADCFSEDWLKLLEKHEDILKKETFFDVDYNVQQKKGILEIAGIEFGDEKNQVYLNKVIK